MAPVVNLKSRLGNAHSLHSATKGVGILYTEIVQDFVASSERQHEVTEFTLRDVPSHSLPDFQGFGHIAFPKLPAIVQGIGQRHRLIHPLKVVSLLRSAGTQAEQKQGKILFHKVFLNSTQTISSTSPLAPPSSMLSSPFLKKNGSFSPLDIRVTERGLVEAGITSLS